MTTTDLALITALRQEIQALFGGRGAILASTIVLANARGMPMEKAIAECERLTRLFINRHRSEEVGQRLRAVLRQHQNPGEETA